VRGGSVVELEKNWGDRGSVKKRRGEGGPLRVERNLSEKFPRGPGKEGLGEKR